MKFSNLNEFFEPKDPEPNCDIATCSECGFSAGLKEFESYYEGGWESGYYETHLCPHCDDGGWVDDYGMSEEQAAKWNEWHKRNKSD